VSNFGLCEGRGSTAVEPFSVVVDSAIDLMLGEVYVVFCRVRVMIVRVGLEVAVQVMPFDDVVVK
jgi:hypothetical protein